MHELFVTEVAAARYPELLRLAPRFSLITRRAAELLSETASPQGIVAVCDTVTVSLQDALFGEPSLVAILVEITDPGNAGTIVRVADAAGADAVIVTGDSVDVHNGKCARASTGSLFHLPIAWERDSRTALAACERAGMRTVATDGYAEQELTTLPETAAPTAWVFGHESHGLPGEVLSAVDHAVRIPLYGRAESLNLATAAAICLYSGVVRGGGRGE